jgi:tetratricopeptide (TPR) repeat protein
MHRAAELSQGLRDPRAEGETLYVLSYVCWLQGRPEEALEHADRAADRFGAAGDDRWLAKALNAVGWYRALGGDHAGAMPYYERALALLEALGDDNNAVVTLDIMALSDLESGLVARGAERLERALGKARAAGNRPMEGQLLLHLGDAHGKTSDADTARSYWRRAYEVFAEAGHAQAAEAAERLGLSEYRMSTVA